jgi:hypothetical protein
MDLSGWKGRAISSMEYQICGIGGKSRIHFEFGWHMEGALAAY